MTPAAHETPPHETPPPPPQASVPPRDAARDAALDLAGRGLAVVPVYWLERDGSCGCGSVACERSAGKHPVAELAPRGVLSASANLVLVDRWWRAEPRAGIGIATGDAISVVDVDDLAALGPLEAELGALPAEAPRVRTGRGMHVYFRGAHRTIMASPAVQLKGAGGYVVAPPSAHRSGRRYSWEVPLPARLDDIPELPPAWAAFLAACGGGVLARTARTYAPTAGAREGVDARATRLGQAFAARGWLGVPSRGNPRVWPVRCPWAGDHTDGRGVGADSSSAIVVVGEAGVFRCLHGHCARPERQGTDAVLAALGEPAVSDDALRVLAAYQGRGPSASASASTSASTSDWTHALSWQVERGVTHWRATVPGLAAVLAHHPDWAGSLEWDAFFSSAVWRRGLVAPGLVSVPGGSMASDVSDAHVQLACASTIRAVPGCRAALTAHVSAEVARGACNIAARTRTTHTVERWLASLAWDGVPRVASWGQRYLGVASAAEARACEWWLISAVARACEPGCQVDHAIVLEGAEALRKSSAIAALVPDRTWLREQLPNLRDDVRVASALRGCWIAVIDELAALDGASVEKIKAMVTTRVDIYRGAYARDEAHQPRSCVFVASTNRTTYLEGGTGNRRWWPVRVREVDIDGLAADRAQLWAEAHHLYQHGAPWWPTSPEDVLAARELAAAREADDPWIDTARRTLGDRPYATTAEMLDAIGVPLERRTRRDEMRAGELLRGLGLERARAGGRWIYRRPKKEESPPGG